MSGDKSGQAPNEHRTSGEIDCNQGNGNNGGSGSKDFFSNFPLKGVYTSYAPSMMSQGKTPLKDPALGVFPASVGAIHLERPPQINVNLQFLRGLSR